MHIWFPLQGIPLAFRILRTWPNFLKGSLICQFQDPFTAVAQGDGRGQHHHQAVGQRHRAGVCDHHGGELVRAVGERDPVGHGPGEVVIDGRRLAVDGQAGDAVAQRAGHGQQIVVEKHVGQLVCIISLEGLKQGVIAAGETPS